MFLKDIVSEVLNDNAPSYFRYMEYTAGKPTILAKLLGFYTVEVKNLESGNTQSKADLLVMENLFYGHNIAKTFDLKGIQERRVKSNGAGQRRTTFFDGEWIEGLDFIHAVRITSLIYYLHLQTRNVLCY